IISQVSFKVHYSNTTAPTQIYTLSLHDALPILDNQKEIAEMQNETQKEIAGIQSATSRQNTKDQVYAQNEMLAYQQKEWLKLVKIGRAVQQECRDRSRMPSSA